MLLAYLLLFLHLSASACDATSRNLHLHLLVNPGAGADVPAPSPAIHYHRRIGKDLFYHLHYSATPPSRTVEVSGLVGVQRPPEDEISAAMEPSPSPASWQVDGGDYGDAGGWDVGGGDDGRSSPVAAATDQEERAGDVGVDYEAPKTHPPSHN